MKSLATALAAMTLAGCGVTADNSICDRANPIGTPEQEEAKPVNILASECVQRWGYRLAKSEGAVAEVAEGVLGACELAILRDRDELAAQYLSQAPDAQREALKNQAFKDATEDRDKYWRRIAAFRVAQGRAGKCPT